jgi:hypothetical protein
MPLTLIGPLGRSALTRLVSISAVSSSIHPGECHGNEAAEVEAGGHHGPALGNLRELAGITCRVV